MVVKEDGSVKQRLWQARKKWDTLEGKVKKRMGGSVLISGR
jgi:hypothetical protein